MLHKTPLKQDYILFRKNKNNKNQNENKRKIKRQYRKLNKF